MGAPVCAVVGAPYAHAGGVCMEGGVCEAGFEIRREIEFKLSQFGVTCWSLSSPLFI